MINDACVVLRGEKPWKKLFRRREDTSKAPESCKSCRLMLWLSAKGHWRFCPAPWCVHKSHRRSIKWHRKGKFTINYNNIDTYCAVSAKHFGDKQGFIAAIIKYRNRQWKDTQKKIVERYKGDPRRILVESSMAYVD